MNRVLFKIIKNIIVMAICINCSMCATVPVNERREGIINESFRIYVRIDSLEIKDYMTDADVNKILIEKSILRFEKLWNSIIVFKMENIPKDINESIINSKNSAKIYYRKEREDYAEAYVDFIIEKKVKENYEKIYPPVNSDNEDEDN
jgi:hypothetical protein